MTRHPRPARWPVGLRWCQPLANYKIPDIHAAPDIDIEFLADAAEPAGLLRSKAVGEPPFLYGIGAYLALLQAIAAFRPQSQQQPPLALDAPLTSVFQKSTSEYNSAIPGAGTQALQDPCSPLLHLLGDLLGLAPIQYEIDIEVLRDPLLIGMMALAIVSATLQT